MISQVSQKSLSLWWLSVSPTKNYVWTRQINWDQTNIPRQCGLEVKLLLHVLDTSTGPKLACAFWSCSRVPGLGFNQNIQQNKCILAGEEVGKETRLGKHYGECHMLPVCRYLVWCFFGRWSNWSTREGSNTIMMASGLVKLTLAQLNCALVSCWWQSLRLVETCVQCPWEGCKVWEEARCKATW